MISAYLHSVSEVLAELHERGFYADCSALVTDHRRLTGPQDVFLAVPGKNFDPRNLADDLLMDQRCGLVLVDYNDQRAYQSASVVPVLNLKGMLAELAGGYYKTAGAEMTVIAVTGTNGKTTVTRWLAQTLNFLGHKAAVIGTLGFGAPDDLKAHTGLTTPDVVGVHHLLHLLRSQQFDTVCIEASSIGLEQGRLAGVNIDVALFTNLSQDHLDYHGDMATYAQAKLILANWPTLRFAVVNSDDPVGLDFKSIVESRKVPCVAVGAGAVACCRIVSIAHTEQGQRIRLSSDGDFADIESPVIGHFNAENLALVFATLSRLGHPNERLLTALAKVTPAPGRMQRIDGQPAVIVDYAHTPDALEKTLQAILPFARKREGKLWVVFGCGGDRDRAKRPLMGAVAMANSDVVVLTSDNPRSEKPQDIAKDIQTGIDPALSGVLKIELNRAHAIEFAIRNASAQDVVVLAGKGHESTQTIGQQVIPHSDAECAQIMLARRSDMSASVLNWDLDEIGHVLADQLQEVAPCVSGSVRLIQTDSRQVAAGDLFVCLAGERFDAHDFAAEVAQAGACALITNRMLDVPVAQFVVKDTRVALGTLASAWRHRFNVKVLGVVGSNGKTTSKEMLGSICKAQFGADHVLVTAGNLNNDIGVPQTLLNLRDTHQVAVIEMGMNHPGEIAYLAGLVKPDVVLLTNAQREHQEFMKTVMAVARENGSAFEHLPKNGTAVFPVSEEFEPTWCAQSTGERSLRFGAGADFDLQPSSQAGETDRAVLSALGAPLVLRPAFIGEHNYANAAGAAAAAYAAGCNAQAIQAGLEAFQPVSGRLQIALRLPSLLLINDSYNANPDSVNAASKVLSAQQGNTLLILGDMGEVGDQSDEYHMEVGQFAKQVGVTNLHALGEATKHTVRAFGEGAFHFNTIEQLIQDTMSTTSQGHWSVLVKGSRFMKMERVVQALVQYHAAEAKHAS